MRFFHFFVWCSILAVVSACEGECINGTTNQFIKKYSSPVKAIQSQAAQMIAQKFSISESSSLEAIMYDAYQAEMYNPLELAIFPGYFHGKCQRNGVDPPGCPNPDCPVVCGTPGSMVHFYSILRKIVYDKHHEYLSNCTDSSSPVFSKIHAHVMDTTSRCSESPRHYSRAFGALWQSKSSPDTPHVRSCSTMASKDVSKELVDILKTMQDQLADECDAKHNLSKCSWDEEMKKYILQYP